VSPSLADTVATVVTILAVIGAHRWTLSTRAFWWTVAGLAVLWLVIVPAIGVWGQQ
jgi:hypothetical protein